jgi:signal recognition particle GTPase
MAGRILGMGDMLTLIEQASGTTVSQVNKLLKQYRDMRRMMRDINAAGGLEAFGKKVFKA